MRQKMVHSAKFTTLAVKGTVWLDVQGKSSFLVPTAEIAVSRFFSLVHVFFRTKKYDVRRVSVELLQLWRLHYGYYMEQELYGRVSFEVLIL